MKKLIISALFLTMLGCGEPKELKEIKQNYPTVAKIQVFSGEGRDSTSIHLYVIDSCEYIGRIYEDRADMLTHKGNCRNSLHTKIYKKNGK